MLKNLKERVELKAAALAGVATMALAFAGKAFAQTPIYTMDSSVSAGAQDLVASMSQTYIQVILLVLGAVGVIVVTIFGLNKFLGWARGKFLHG